MGALKFVPPRMGARAGWMFGDKRDLVGWRVSVRPAFVSQVAFPITAVIGYSRDVHACWENWSVSGMCGM